MSEELKILIVEDDPTLRLVTQKALGHLGYKSIAVSSGEEALEPDPSVALIFMDIGLPGIDGVHATKLIRQREIELQAKRKPIIALTAHWDREGYLAAGMDDFLQKPAMIEDLKRVCQKWIPDPGNC